MAGGRPDFNSFWIFAKAERPCCHARWLRRPGEDNQAKSGHKPYAGTQLKQQIELDDWDQDEQQEKTAKHISSTMAQDTAGHKEGSLVSRGFGEAEKE